MSSEAAYAQRAVNAVIDAAREEQGFGARRRPGALAEVAGRLGDARALTPRPSGAGRPTWCGGLVSGAPRQRCADERLPRVELDGGKGLGL